MRNRKHTAWKKSRKFGDVKGGREWPKITDNIFNRLHSFSRPGPHDKLPILIEDNPSGDFIFPLNGSECLEALKALPEGDQDGITHVWLRRLTSRERKNGHSLAEFICGSGVRVIVMYPWRKDLRLCLGKNKPTGKIANEYARYKAKLFQESDLWYVQFELPELRKFCVQVLFHEVGHHVDWYRRHWSGANGKKLEEFADQYAMSFTNEGAQVLNEMNERVD